MTEGRFTEHVGTDVRAAEEMTGIFLPFVFLLPALYGRFFPVFFIQENRGESEWRVHEVCCTQPVTLSFVYSSQPVTRLCCIDSAASQGQVETHLSVDKCALHVR